MSQFVAINDVIARRIEFDTNGGCWLWTGYLNHGGYGVMGVPKQRRTALVHRLALEARDGPIPDGLRALHKCDVRACVNPAHLYAGTSMDNARDREERGRRVGPMGERNGRAVITEAQVRDIRRSNARSDELAAQFGVGRLAIQRIRGRRSWRHVR